MPASRLIPGWRQPRAGKPYQTEHLVELAREAMENFVNAQKHFMDVIADETAKATGAKHSNGFKKIKKTELPHWRGRPPNRSSTPRGSWWM